MNDTDAILRELREEIAVRETRLALINREIENLRVVIRMVEATAQASAEEAARNARRYRTPRLGPATLPPCPT